MHVDIVRVFHISSVGLVFCFFCLVFFLKNKFVLPIGDIMNINIDRND